MKENKLIKEGKNTLKVGIGTMAGMGALGALSDVPGMPVQASQSAGVASTGLGLINVGQLAKTGLALGETLSGQQKKRKTGNKFIDRII